MDKQIEENNLPQFYTIEAVAKYLKVSEMTLKRYINRKKNPLPVIYLSDRTIRIPIDQFEIWLKSLEEKDND